MADARCADPPRSDESPAKSVLRRRLGTCGEFQSADWLIDPVSEVLDETIRSPSGISWRVQRRAGATVVRRDSGSPVSIAGDWALGVVTARGHRSGVSADGSTLVLADVASRNRFAVIRFGKVRVLQFSGSFAIDAVSNDGRMLYLTESVEDSTATYAVRKADLATGILVADPVENVDVNAKGPIPASTDGRDPTMRGKPIDRTLHTDGWTYTLYFGTTHTYVHALDSRSGGVSLCFDLPSAWNSRADTIRLVGQGEAMTVTRSGRTLGRLVGTRPGSSPRVELLAT